MSPPSLFVIGDSISMHYGPHLERMLAGRFAYARKTGQEPEVAGAPPPVTEPNGGDSAAVLAWLEAMLAGGRFRPDVLLINCGLHDIKTDFATGAKQVPLEAYRRNLRRIVSLLAEAGLRAVWVRTTPVDDATHNSRAGFGRYAADQRAYNAAADEVMSAAGVPLADLDGFTASLGGPAELYCDHVHFHEPIRRLQAAFLAGWLNGDAA